jgi:hypothetical protein
MLSDSTDRIRELEVYNFKDTEEVAVLKFLIKRGSADFQKPGRSKAERDKIASKNMSRRHKLWILINEIKYRNAEIANLQDTSL